MPTVAAMIADPAGRRLTAEQAGALATVRFCDRVESLIEIVAAGNLDAVVADLHDVSGVSVMPTFALLHRQMPHLPLVLFCPPTPKAVRELPLSSAMFRGMTLVFRNCEHLGVALAPLLGSSPVPSAGETLARHVVPLVPAPFQPFVLVCACKASPRLRVRTAARWSGSSRRTLERSLRLAGLPSAGAVLGSCTALHAAWWLDVQGWSAKQVVADMRFSHASALSRVLRRHFGCTVKSLRDEGGFGELLCRFEATLLGGPVTSEPARSA